MKRNLIRKLYTLMKYSFFIITIQTISLNLLLADISNAQKAQSIREVAISLESRQDILVNILEEIESKTDYKFAYNGRVNKKVNLLWIKRQKMSVFEILSEIANQTELDFKQVNKTINVSRSKNKLGGAVKTPVVRLADVDIVGKIVDENGQGLPGASVVVKGTSNGVTTNLEGDYKLSVPENAVLVVSFVGYVSQEVDIAGRSTIDLQLELDAAQLDEVVVVGYGTVKKRDMTSAIAQVSSGDIDKRVATRLDDALQGKMAGVLIQQTSGVPGAAPVIRIRGTNSITEGNQPLFVIDGMPIEDAVIIANLNMNDVASVEVLKDAASAAIYGSRGSNGVVIVTTKKGRSGAPQITYSAHYGVQQAEKRLDLLTGPEYAEYAIERREWLISQNPAYDLNTPNADRPRKLRIDPNWASGNVQTFDPQDEIFRTAPIQSHNLSISGGSENTTYLMSMAILDQEGIVKNTSFDRYAFRINLESQIQKRIKVGLNLAPSFSTQMDNNSEGKDQGISGALRSPPIFDWNDIYWDESSQRHAHDYLNEVGNNTNGLPFRMYGMDHIEQEFKRNQLLSSAFINVDLIEGLSYRTTIHYRQNSLKSNDYRDLKAGNGVRSAKIGNGYNTNWTLENTLNYSKLIGKHSITGLVGYSSQKDYSEDTRFEGRGFVNDIILSLGAAASIPAWSHDIQEWSLLSSFARATYSYDSRYMLTASIRRDGSSRFGANNKWGIFPAVSAAWRISDESFMSSQTTFNNLKLRGSFGVTGNNRIGNYRPFAALFSSNAILGSGGSNVVGLIPGSFENQDLSWEKNQTVNLGLDIGILQDKMTFAFDVYKSNTKDLLLNVPVPHTTGFGSAIQNIGEVQNKGFEIEISSNNITTSNFSWTSSIVFSYNQNKVLKMGPDGSPIKNGDFWCRDCSYTGIGYPIGSFNLYETDGIYMSQAEVDAVPQFADEGVGDVKWVDVNGDGDVNALDRRPLGNPTPITNFGITNTLNYKGFDLNLFINGAGGHETFFAWSRYISRPSTGVLLKEWTNRYRSPENPGNGIVPQGTSDTGTNGGQEENDRWLYDSDWWRIKNLTLGYTFPAASLEKLKISSFRLYVSADNLFLNTKYPGFNPEGGLKPNPDQGTTQSESVFNSRFSQNQSPSFNLGMDFGSSPLAKRFIVGLNITF
ncbi:MAG: TonB-dependent receptor [Cyclobacteriaceae bacterium]